MKYQLGWSIIGPNFNQPSKVGTFVVNLVQRNKLKQKFCQIFDINDAWKLDQELQDNFDYSLLEEIVDKSFTMDKVRCSGLSKYLRKPEVEWKPQEIDIDSCLEIVHCFNQDGTSFYNASILWKDKKIPDLMNKT